MTASERLLAALAALALAVPPFLAPSALASGRPVAHGVAEATAPQRLAYRVPEATIRVDRFAAAGPGPHPAVVLLHGADGADAPHYAQAAAQMAAAGYETFLIRYLDRSGERRAEFSSIPYNLPVWTDAVRRGIAFVAAQPQVDPRRIAIVGTSLGGTLGLLAAADNPRVKALVNFFGFNPRSLYPRAKLPPTLTLHGTADDTVPVTNARAIDARLASTGTPRETVIYPGQGHGFTGAADADARARAIAFLDRTLGLAR